MELPLPDFGAGFTAGAVASKDNAVSLAIGTTPSHALLVTSENVVEMSNLVVDRLSMLGKGVDFLPITFAHGDTVLTPEQLIGGKIFVSAQGGPRTLFLPSIQQLCNYVDAHKIPLSTAYVDNVTQTFYKGVIEFDIISLPNNVTLRTPVASLVPGHAGTSGYRSIKLADGSVTNLPGNFAVLSVDSQPVLYKNTILLERGADGIVWGYLFFA